MLGLFKPTIHEQKSLYYFNIFKCNVNWYQSGFFPNVILDNLEFRCSFDQSCLALEDHKNILLFGSSKINISISEADLGLLQHQYGKWIAENYIDGQATKKCLLHHYFISFQSDSLLIIARLKTNLVPRYILPVSVTTVAWLYNNSY